jgi:hypothetical protein
MYASLWRGVKPEEKNRLCTELWCCNTRGPTNIAKRLVSAWPSATLLSIEPVGSDLRLGTHPGHVTACSCHTVTIS